MNANLQKLLDDQAPQRNKKKTLNITVLNSNKDDPVQQPIKIAAIKSRKLSVSSTGQPEAQLQAVDSIKRIVCLKQDMASPKTVFSVEQADSQSIVGKPDKTFRTDQSDSGRANKKEESPNRIRAPKSSVDMPRITLNKANIKILKTSKPGYINLK